MNNELINESDDLILNEAFKSKIVQGIYSKGGLGKDLFKGLSKYGFSIAEIEDDVDITRLALPVQTPMSVPENPEPGFWTKYHTVMNAYQSELNASCEKAANLLMTEYTKRFKESRYVREPDVDVLVLKGGALQARFRMDSRSAKNGYFGGGGVELYEATKEITTIFNAAKKNVGKNYAVGETISRITKDGGYELYYMVSNPKDKEDARKARRSNTNSSDRSTRDPREQPYDESGSNIAKQIIEKFVKDMKLPPNVKARIHDESITFNLEGTNYELATLYFHRSFRDLTLQNIELSMSSNRVNFDKSNALERQKIKVAADIVTYLEKNIDKFLAQIRAINRFKSARSDAKRRGFKAEQETARGIRGGKRELRESEVSESRRDAEADLVFARAGDVGEVTIAKTAPPTIQALKKDYDKSLENVRTGKAQIEEVIEKIKEKRKKKESDYEFRVLARKYKALMHNHTNRILSSLEIRLKIEKAEGDTEGAKKTQDKMSKVKAERKY